MNYKIIDKNILFAYKEGFNNFNISFKTFPVKEKGIIQKDKVKIGYSFKHLKQQIDFYNYMKIKYLGDGENE